MKVLVTGADGFVGKNLSVVLAERPGIEILRFTRESTAGNLQSLVASADFIFHLAGVNRPTEPQDFMVDNVDLTAHLCAAVVAAGRPIPVVLSSSTQADRDNDYGRSKRAAEGLLAAMGRTTGSPVYLFRLPNVFGKWCRPNYNSAVANFCHNISRGLPIRIDDANAVVTLVYIDDVVSTFVSLLDGSRAPVDLLTRVAPEYRISVGALADQIRAFQHCRSTLVSERVGTGLTRALYATYVSYLPTESFVYEIPQYGDARGVFVEMLKTPDCGQFSFFTAHPGVTRGGHYHHSKTEKFLVIKGKAHFRFRQLLTGAYHEVTTTGEKPVIVETVPGWTHDITNIGEDEMVVMLWANEIFDRGRPDTVARAL